MHRVPFFRLNLFHTEQDLNNDLDREKVKLFVKLVLATGIILLVKYLEMYKFKRYRTSQELPDKYLKNSKLRGTVVNVADGDTIRFYHTPTFSFNPKYKEEIEKLSGPWSGKSEGERRKKSTGGPKLKLSEHSMLIRVYGVDAPEMGHFGNPEQPFAKESKEFVQKLLMNKKVTLVPLSKDQYQRLVCAVYYHKWYFIKKDLSEKLLKEGLAEVYTGGGAQYQGKKDTFLRLQETAKLQKKGVWSQKAGEHISPMQYKKKVRENTR